jgi:hypothetical protein
MLTRATVKYCNAYIDVSIAFCCNGYIDVSIYDYYIGYIDTKIADWNIRYKGPPHLADVTAESSSIPDLYNTSIDSSLLANASMCPGIV